MQNQKKVAQHNQNNKTKIESLTATLLEQQQLTTPEQTEAVATGVGGLKLILLAKSSP